MKKFARIVLIGTGIFVVLLLLVAGGFYFKFKSETEVMTPAETGKIVDNIFAIKDAFVNMYLIKDGNQYVAVDAGEDIGIVSAELRKLNIDANMVAAVVLTHTDMDHAAALSLFKNATVYLSKPEELMLTGQKQKIPFVSNSISRKDYAVLEDGQTFIIGNVKIHGILTAGHTSGSMCYLVNDKYLFTGDVLSVNAGRIAAFVKFFDMDHEMANRAIAKITKLSDAEYILTAHHGYTNDYKNAVKDWKE